MTSEEHDELLIESQLSGRSVEELKRALRPMHSDIVANVFDQGASAGSRYCILHLGGSGPESPGTEGDFNIAHNLFIMTRKVPGDIGSAILVSGNVDNVRLLNNAFVDGAGIPFRVLEAGEIWMNEDTKSFMIERGRLGPIVSGTGNWVDAKAVSIPESLKNGLKGDDPNLEDQAARAFRPLPKSPLVKASTTPMPPGKIGPLTPLFEPIRGIPADLRPRVRRDAAKPSIGPFEPGEGGAEPVKVRDAPAP